MRFKLHSEDVDTFEKPLPPREETVVYGPLEMFGPVVPHLYLVKS